MELLAERGLDVSRRTILRWAQALGPLLGQAVRRQRLPFGQQWFVDEVFVRIGGPQHTWPDVRHRRSGLHRTRGVTTKPVERSHIPTRDRLRNSRGLKTTATAQRFLEGFEALYALRHGHVLGVSVGGSEHERVRQVTAAFLQLGRHLRRAR
jgi:transposase-like protein